MSCTIEQLILCIIVACGLLHLTTTEKIIVKNSHSGSAEPRVGFCPFVPPGIKGTCKAANCTVDTDCYFPKDKCCPSGCGKMCVPAVDNNYNVAGSTLTFFLNKAYKITAVDFQTVHKEIKGILYPCKSCHDDHGSCSSKQSTCIPVNCDFQTNYMNPHNEFQDKLDQRIQHLYKLHQATVNRISTKCSDKEVIVTLNMARQEQSQKFFLTAMKQLQDDLDQKNFVFTFKDLTYIPDPDSTEIEYHFSSLTNGAWSATGIIWYHNLYVYLAFAQSLVLYKRINQ